MDPRGGSRCEPSYFFSYSCTVDWGSRICELESSWLCLGVIHTPSASIPKRCNVTSSVPLRPAQLALHQSSPHPSSLPLPAAPPPFIALVPSVLGLPCSAVTSEAPKLSQKSGRSGATVPLLAALPAFSSWPSTNLLRESAAPLALDWIVWPACIATVRACAANSDDAIYRQDQYLEQ
jgi:hypothetical protein